MSHKRNRDRQPTTKNQQNAELQEQLTKALAVIEKLRKQNELLRAEIEELKRAGKRQAAPFARRKLVEHPKRPRRKAGQGKFSRRERPALKQVDKPKKAMRTDSFREASPWGTSYPEEIPMRDP